MSADRPPLTTPVKKRVLFNNTMRVRTVPSLAVIKRNEPYLTTLHASTPTATSFNNEDDRPHTEGALVNVAYEHEPNSPHTLGVPLSRLRFKKSGKKVKKTNGIVTPENAYWKARSLELQERMNQRPDRSRPEQIINDRFSFLESDPMVPTTTGNTSVAPIKPIGARTGPIKDRLSRFFVKNHFLPGGRRTRKQLHRRQRSTRSKRHNY